MFTCLPTGLHEVNSACWTIKKNSTHNNLCPKKVRRSGFITLCPSNLTISTLRVRIKIKDPPPFFFLVEGGGGYVIEKKNRKSLKVLDRKLEGSPLLVIVILIHITEDEAIIKHECLVHVLE